MSRNGLAVDFGQRFGGRFPRTDIYTPLLSFALILVGVSAIYEHSWGRYLKYLIPFFALSTIPLRKKMPLYRFEYTAPFSLLIVYAMLTFVTINIHGLKDIFFIFAGMCVFLLYRPRPLNIGGINLVLIAAFFILKWHTFDFTRGISLQMSASISLVESNFSTLLGLFAVYALVKRNWLLLIINLSTIMIDLKRIALLALLLCAIFQVFPRSWKRFFLSPCTMGIINLLLVVFLVQLAEGKFEETFQDLFGMSGQWLTMGRNNLYSGVVDGIKQSAPRVLFFGDGVGSAYDATIQSLGFYSNLHSDILKVFYEYGSFCFIAFLSLLYRPKDINLKLLALYLNVILLVDNVLIFTHFLFFYFLISGQITLTSKGERWAHRDEFNTFEGSVT